MAASWSMALAETFDQLKLESEQIRMRSRELRAEAARLRDVSEQLRTGLAS